ncbi:MAG: dehypoxanthine futalosine cyclase [Nitrospirae bacterium]|nr:dehypoxanthine futalosine cyclase [Nitrospirota bacterium]
MITTEKRISEKEGINLFETSDLLTLGDMANSIRKRIHPEKRVTFVIDRNINYTNICINKCRFCAYYRDENDSDAYILSNDEIFRKIEEILKLGGTQILLQGGLHPSLPIDYYTDLLRSIKRSFPIHIHAFSPPEIIHFARLSDLTIREILTILKESGLDSIPGGGAEILVDKVRGIISPKKIKSDEWIEVMEIAHGIGIPSSATMMFGSVEKKADIIKHLIRLRELQDRTGGFTAFIPWTFQPLNTEISSQFTVHGSQFYPATGVEYLKVLAISRIILNNIKNIQVSWVTQGPKMAQVALKFGANDFGSTMIEENVVSAAGTTYRMTKEEIVEIIRDAGYIPAQRNTLYGIIRIYDS